MPTLAMPSVRLNYVQLGTGHDLVLIHGLGTNLSFWYFGAARLLAAKRNLLMYDLRGHGRSSMPQEGYGLPRMARDLLDLLDFLAIERIDLVGHSFGGRVALVFAALYPERVRSIVIADTQIRALQPPMRLSEWPHWQGWKAELIKNGLTNPPAEDAIIDYELLVQLSQYRDNAAGDGGATRIALHSRNIGEKGMERWRQLLQRTSASREFDEEPLLVPATLRTIAAPILLLFGRFSHCLPTAEGLMNCLPDARLIVIPGAGHFFPIVKPRFFARATEGFLTRQENGAMASVPARRRFRRFGAKPLPA
jgi:pimeloyl-ACP methyl ester carboxylesterase